MPYTIHTPVLWPSVPDVGIHTFSGSFKRPLIPLSFINYREGPYFAGLVPPDFIDFKSVILLKCGNCRGMAEYHVDNFTQIWLAECVIT